MTTCMQNIKPVHMGLSLISRGYFMARKNRRAARYTILMVAEGDSDAVFLDHLRRLYVTRGCGTSTKVRNAHGCGPKHIVEFAIRQTNNANYDRVVTFLDTDIEWTDPVRGLARRKRILMLGSTPCLEGLLLKILDIDVPGNCRDCKRLISDVLNGSSLSDPSTYQRHFDFDLLERKRREIEELEDLIAHIKK